MAETAVKAQHARGAGVDPAGHVAGALDDGEQAVGLVEEGQAGPRELDVPVVAIEQVGADGALELLDLAGERGLGHLQPLRRG